MQTLPVYRIRDGYDQLKNNDQVFERCYELLGEKKHMMMFSEGRHHDEYYLLRLSKGSSRLVMEAQLRHPNHPIYLQPGRVKLRASSPCSKRLCGCLRKTVGRSKLYFRI